MIEEAIRPFENGSPARSEMTICARLFAMAGTLDDAREGVLHAVARDLVVDESDLSSLVQRAARGDVDGRALDLGKQDVVARRRVEIGGETGTIRQPVRRTHDVAAVHVVQV